MKQATEHLLDLVVEGVPVPKARPRRARHGRFYTPRPTEKAEEKLRDAARTAWAGRHQMPFTEPVAIDVVFWLPTKRRVDLDNLLKLVTDALMPDVLADDSQIWSLGAHKASSKEHPRTEISLYALAGVDSPG